ncbi:LON peptidase substrate-binding domain-containing protein [Roseococcus sp. SDR]|uniref:LON peptidase substrate-binding domain-containing protein n=1 Tax=Roseococcus sp. SDR TaxID=2835532 RepID=UPI001BCE9D7D|nr:LON peptidase substrate-binding domain-containing protein [Roseococcus sp. SDR]MBS7791915.1 LON peptidase substrate-binding domain-containing protein [Roseococcus sp. SDR]MBV1847229.1 LON peptidase substrate-binding domain-containing protein [Roseococcus sp. SDR]
MQDPFQPAPEQLPAEIAIFPLSGALLLPGGKLPLNIFEPRYLAMTLDSLAEGRMFGMIQGDPSQPRDERGSTIYRVGCLGRLSSFAETEDGRLLITLTGVTRFRVAEEIEMRRGYRRVRADYTPYTEDFDPPAPEDVPREAILDALRPYFAAKGIEANWDAITEMAGPALVTTLAMVCPFAVPEKQALLEAPTLAHRATSLVALLKMAAHGGGELPPGGRPS